MSSSTPVHDAGSVLTAKILESGKYSDLTIESQRSVFKVHRNIVCLQSKPLAAHVDGQFQESITGVMKLDHDDPGAIQRLISFMYTRAYALDSKSKTPLLDHCRVYVLAEKYDVPDLKNLAKSVYEKSISNDWDNDWDDDDFIQSLRLMYDETPKSDRQLKDVAIPVACHQKERLLCYEPFTTLMEDIGEIGVDMMKEELSWRTKELLPGLPFFSQYPPFLTSRGGFKSKSNLSSTTAPAPTTRSTNEASLISSSQSQTLTSGPSTFSTATSVQAPSPSRRGSCVKRAVTMTGPSISNTVVVNGAVTTSRLPNLYVSSPYTSSGLVPGSICPNCNSLHYSWRWSGGKSTYKCQDCDTVF